MHRLNPGARMAIEAALRAGNKMQAIRLYMQFVPGASMEEARQAIEEMLPGQLTQILPKQPQITPRGPNDPLISDNSIMSGFSYEHRLEIASALFEGDKIEAVKIYLRIMPKATPAEAKRIIELFEIELYKAYPSHFVRQPKKKESRDVIYLIIGSIIVMIIVIYLIIIFS